MKRLVIGLILTLPLAVVIGAGLTPGRTPEFLAGVTPTRSSWFVDEYLIRDQAEGVQSRIEREMNDSNVWTVSGNMTYAGGLCTNYVENRFFFVEWSWLDDGCMKVEVTRKSLFESVTYRGSEEPQNVIPYVPEATIPSASSR